VRPLLFVLLLVAFSATAQDYAREKRWAAEVVPNLVVGDAVQLRLADKSEFLGIYTKPDAARTAILLVHGIGVHPDHGVIGILRTTLADMGYATLSIQMPVQESDAAPDDYVSVFPEAAARIHAGADWLAAKGFTRPVLLSHSMGSRMANVYFERTPDAPFAAWVCMGLSGDFGRMGNVKVPVLDVFGENDLPGVLRADWRRRLKLNTIPGSAQVMVKGADHFYVERERRLAGTIREFLERLK